MFWKSRKNKQYTVNVEGIHVQVSRKSIKNLYVRVNRANGEVRVSCPHRISEAGLAEFIRDKADWIRKHQAKVKERPQPAKLAFIEGELHSYLGKQYPLKIIVTTGRQHVVFDETSLVIYVKKDSTRQKREKLLDEWYRERLKELIPELVSRYEPMMGVNVSEFGVKKMKTRWGTCNIRAQRIWLNLELAKKPVGCLEMVVVHEMVHLLERLHNKRFYSLMNTFMPAWKNFENKLDSQVD